MKEVILCKVLVSLLIYGTKAFNILPRPSVYVVTPSPKSQQYNEARSAPFYYHNWMRRMDSPQNTSTTTTSTTPKVKTPDLIFAEFESDNENNMRKSIRKLLEQERVASKTSTVPSTTITTSHPIYVPEASNVNDDLIYAGLKKKNGKDNDKNSEIDKTDYFALYNKLYSVPMPVLSKTTSTTTTTTTTTTPAPTNVENIWHIIDNEKHNQYVDKWEEVPIEFNKNDDDVNGDKSQDKLKMTKAGQINEDFALPGFGTHPGNGAENESRAIHNEPNDRFPYVSLKPFQVKTHKKPFLDNFSNSKKVNNMLTSLDNFKEIKYPVRGEVQESIPMQQPVDRYNPAQPYLPQEYASKSKQSNPNSAPPEVVASLVPPPPPPPKATGDDFPAPTNYESFPPYDSPAPPPPAFNFPVSIYRPPPDTSDDAAPNTLNDNNDNKPVDLGQRYKPPSSSYLPTLPPLYKHNKGYSYDKPEYVADTPPVMDTDGYTYKKPAIPFDSYSPPIPDYKPDFHGYHYNHDHDSYHYHHHTTTTTTETPRVNRYSYYYLGKKLYYLPLYFSVYFIVYVGALIIKAVLRHKIVYPNSWQPDGTTATFFSKRSVESWNLTNDNLHEITGRMTKAIADAAEKYINEEANTK